MNTCRFTCCACLALAIALPAQVVTFPSDHAAVPDGPSSQNWFPYSSGIGRYQAIYDSWDLRIPAGRQITRIGFRAEPSVMSFGRTLQLQVRMGPSHRWSGALDITFDNNWHGVPTNVYGPASFQLPDLNNPANPNPGGAVVWLDLTTPHTYDPSRNLLVEWRIFANNNGGFAFSYELDVAGPVSPTVTGPAGCAHSGNVLPVLSSGPAVLGSYWQVTLAQAPANQFVVLLAALSATLTTPYPLQGLIPGIPPTCQGQVPLGGVVTFSSFTDSSGSTLFYTGLPYLPAFRGVTVATQALCLNPSSPGMAVVSNGEQVQVGAYPAMSTAYNAWDPNAVTGSLHSTRLITLFGHN